MLEKLSGNSLIHISHKIVSFLLEFSLLEFYKTFVTKVSTSRGQLCLLLRKPEFAGLLLSTSRVFTELILRESN